MKYSIFSCSCRENGNSAFCASLIQNLYPQSSIYYPCQHNLQHCISCGYCDTHLGQCAYTIMQDDKVYEYYKTLFNSQKAIFIIPIYFYHVPAPLKAFIDRAQAFYPLEDNKKPAQNLRVQSIFLGAREKGDKLFEGAYLSLKYAMHAIGATMEKPLFLYGLDKKDDLSKIQDKQKAIINYIATC